MVRFHMIDTVSCQSDVEIDYKIKEWPATKILQKSNEP